MTETAPDATKAPILQKVRAEKDLLQDRCPDMTVMLRILRLRVKLFSPMYGQIWPKPPKSRFITTRIETAVPVP